MLFCLLTFPVVASHIVGGEFELFYLSGDRYRLRLIYYFDLKNNTFSIPPELARPELQEPNILAAIFRKSDNFRMTNVTLKFLSRTKVSYTQPECSKGEILTDKLIYEAEIIMPPSQYNSPEGYYVIWERCCRNYTITNIVSDMPPPNDPNFPNAAGQTFYLEFPPVVKDGQPFINSSPQLFPPLNDYACPNKPYYADFAGTDVDGDSLVYSLTTPLSTHTSQANPPLLSAPYPVVKWRAPFGFNNIVGGKPDLKISEDGFLTVTPRFQGLFVFAVKCEEFRKGVKIGEVRRDFQMLVTDCPAAEPPNIKGKKLTDVDFIYDGTMNVTFSNQVPDDERCIEVQVSDPDASKADQNFQEKITIKAIPLSFKKDISGILPAIKTAILDHGSTKTFRICFDKCPPDEFGPFQVGIVAYDDACSLPLFDTLRVNVNIQPPTNSKPYFTTPNVVQTINEGDKVSWNIRGVDDDNDPLTYALITDGFNLDKVGMTFTRTKLENGLFEATLEWDARCNVYDFTKKTFFEVKVFIEDQDPCNYNHRATMTFKLNIKLPGNADPIISTDLPPNEVQNGAKRKIFESLDFNVFGKDLVDNDFLILDVTPIGFSMENYNISFPKVSGKGSVSSHFSWNIRCDKLNLKAKDEFAFRFVVVDNANKCRFYKADTLTVMVKIEPPDNSPPWLNIISTNPEVNLANNQVSILVGQQIALSLVASDADRIPQPDLVSIDLVEAKGSVEPAGYLFSPAQGNGSAETTFTWDPDCSIFTNDTYENNYTFKFATKDNRCFNPKADTVALNITIKDINGADTEFIPPNIITPNGDGCNDFFAMEELEELLSTKCDEVHPVNLPNDNCIGHFTRIYIYNRWGTKVFESEKRNFRWYPVNEAAGVYFYTLKYSHKEYKGTITLMN